MVCRWQITSPTQSLKCPFDTSLLVYDIQMFLFEEAIREQSQQETPEISAAVKCVCFVYL